MTSAERTGPPSVPADPQPSFEQVALRWACLACALAISVPGLLKLSRIWERTEYLGHGYLIPLVAAWLLYRERTVILRAFSIGPPPVLGPLLVFATASLEVLAVFGDVIFAAGVGIPLLLAATAYAIGGRELLVLTRLPLGFLVLMVPPPGFLINRLLFDLKLFVTKVSVAILQVSDFPVAADGNQILVPNHTLFVADACSGLTSIVTLLPLAVIVAYFLGRGVWRRLVIVASIVPLAVGGNVVRVLVTVYFVSSQGIEFAQGLLHESFGLTTFIVGTLCLLGIARLIR
jgi:exosortase